MVANNEKQCNKNFIFLKLKLQALIFFVLNFPKIMDTIIKRNNVKIKGKGSQPMMFAHGFGCDQHSWQFIVDAFAEDYKIILFDYVGAGQSDHSAFDPEKYSTLEGYCEDVLNICEALDLRNVIFVGHSVSSMIGILATNKKPEYFDKLILIGPSPRYLNDVGYYGGFERKDLENLFEFMDSNYLGWSSTMAPAIMGNATRPELGEFLTSSFCTTDPEIARSFAKTTFYSDNREDLKAVKIPSLTLQCREDIIAPEQVGEFMKKNTPQNTLYLMQATGHCPHISEPEETISAIKNFLK
jgi:sigma-B regulation protein RsbQ